MIKSIKKRIIMKSNEKIFQVFIFIAALASFVSFDRASWAMNFFLLPAIAFTFTGAMLFLIHEKYIINNFTRTLGESFKASLTAAIFFFAAYFEIHFLSPLAAFVTLLSAFAAFRAWQRKDYIFLAFSVLPLCLAYFIPSSFSKPLINAAVLASVFLAETVLFIMLKEVRRVFEENPRETLCYSSVIIAAASAGLFFITKSPNAAILSKSEQMHLFLITFVYTFLSASLLIMMPKAFSFDKRLFAASAAVSAAVLSLFAFSVFFVIASPLAIALFLLDGKRTKKGASITEFMAILTLSAIAVSLLFPVYGRIKDELMAGNDRKLCMEGRENEMKDAIKIGGYYIKSADKRIKFVYSVEKNSFRRFTAE